MQKLKNISIVFFIVLSITIFWGYNIVKCYSLEKSSIENTNSTTQNTNIVSIDIELEKETSVICQNELIQHMHSKCERIQVINCSLPINQKFVIWLPPKVS